MYYPGAVGTIIKKIRSYDMSVLNVIDLFVDQHPYIFRR